MDQHQILIVEDEASLADTIALNLELEHYKVMISRNGGEALSVFMEHHSRLDLVLLDVMLPGINGYDLCKNFKEKDPSVPVIFITAKSEKGEKISGLKLGADDYITKPFDLEELLLRIKNVIKRNPRGKNDVYSFGNCEINFGTFEIKTIKGEITTLSKREIGLLKLLTDHVNKVISRDEIISSLWQESENASSRTIDNYILGFRKYFEENPREPRHFYSIRGVGYKFTS
jgi:two-component system, OmpR family, alkaline phosphatase synthesis response regulator PhoP